MKDMNKNKVFWLNWGSWEMAYGVRLDVDVRNLLT